MTDVTISTLADEAIASVRYSIAFLPTPLFFRNPMINGRNQHNHPCLPTVFYEESSCACGVSIAVSVIERAALLSML